jgi:GTP-binding protein HflX
MELFDRPSGGERALLVHLNISHIDHQDIEEFRLLAQSAGAEIIDLITGTRKRPDARLFVGKGKAEEIRQHVVDSTIDVVIFDHTLSPAQERNLEKVFQCRVVDRTGLILDIFAQRARTFEGKLQVELAQLDHLASRLVRGWTHLERQGGGIGLRGPGETQLETDRRLLQVRVGQLKERLEKVRQTRKQGRAARQKGGIPTISLVGYTNAGKSTLFNRLADSDVYVANQLFATLDPTLRRLNWQGLGPLVLADTVGFVRHLPHGLVESFRATLEETLEADLLLHVIDQNSPDRDEQIDAVEAVLKEIGAEVPILRVYNKIDLSGDAPSIHEGEPDLPDRVYVSAYSGAGIDLLKLAVHQRLATGKVADFHLTLPVAAGRLRSQLYQLGVIQQEHTSDDGAAELTVQLSIPALARLLAEAHVDPDTIMPESEAVLFRRVLEAFELERLDRIRSKVEDAQNEGMVEDDATDLDPAPTVH